MSQSVLYRFSTGVSAMIVAWGIGMSGALAAEIRLATALSGLSEVPPIDGPATGSASGLYDDETRMLSVEVVVEGLIGTVAGAHIHGPSEPSANAGIVFAFDLSDDGDVLPLEAILSLEQEADLLAGLYYVNLHTDAYPSGEVRGHLVVAE